MAEGEGNLPVRLIFEGQITPEDQSRLTALAHELGLRAVEAESVSVAIRGAPVPPPPRDLVHRKKKR